MSQPATNYSSEVGDFLDSLFEGQDGYVYCPTKNAESGYWQPYYFRYPKQKTAIVTHISDQTQSKDCYVAPSLFKAPSDKLQAWKGSSFVWVEFDGNAPENLPDGIPNPSIRIQSSTKGHEHWYWRLDNFETDSKVVSGLSKQLTYTLDADKSGWDASQVLRPPGTIHHDSGRRVRLLSANQRPHSIGDFKNLVVAPESVVLDKFDHVPDSAEVVAKYKWEKDAWDLFQKKSQAVGTRSSAMTRLAFHCVEMGMTNEECYTILYNADERWGKFKNRSPEDRAKRLIGIITHCRGKKSLDKQLHLDDDKERLQSLRDFMARDIKVDWAFDQFLSDKGFGIISGLPGVGKTSIALRLAACVILKQKFLQWNFIGKKDYKVAYLSFEMGSEENNKFLGEMLKYMGHNDKEKFLDNFFLVDRGYSMALWDKKEQQNILEELDAKETNFVIIDSIKAAGGLEEKKSDAFYDWVNAVLRKDRGFTVVFIHHNRKPSNENASKKPDGLSDLYGDMYIGAHATTVFSLWRRGKSLRIIPMKMRLAEMFNEFGIERLPGIQYSISEAVPVKDSNEDGEKPNDRGNRLFGE